MQGRKRRRAPRSVDADEPPAKKARTDYAVFEHEEEIVEANKPSEIEDYFPPITEAMDREIKAAFFHGEQSDIIITAFNINITRGDICRLQEGVWLNSKIVNFYMHLLMERAKKQGYPAIHVLDISFHLELSSLGYTAAKRWTTGVDLFKYDIVFVPIYQNHHLTLAVIDMRQKTIKYFDSMATSSENKFCETLFEYLQEESQEKRQLKLKRSEWTLHSMMPHEIPQQDSRIGDCGVFVCKYADYIARDEPLTFTKSHMPYFRKRMVWEIIHQQLL